MADGGGGGEGGVRGLRFYIMKGRDTSKGS